MTGSGDGGLQESLAGIDEALARGSADEALGLADQALRRWPDEGEVHHARGVALRALERCDEALDELRSAASLAPDLADAWLDSAEILLEDLADPVGALEILDIALDELDDAGARAETNLLRGIALAQLEDYTGALRALDEARSLDPAHPEVEGERGSVLIELLRLEEAEQSLRAAVEARPDDAHALQLLAFVLDYSGRREEATEIFRKASEADPELPVEPPRLTEAEFDKALSRALEKVPGPFRERLANCEIGVENYATREFCRHEDCSPTTLGIYVGTPLPLREGGEPHALPDRIVLFQRALENACRDEEELVEEIGVTLRHEIGHLLGFSEEDLAERGHA